jgi:stage II sporulation protein D
VAAALANWGITSVTSIQIEGVDGAGYAEDVLINGTVRMRAYSFRSALGPNLLRSTAFGVEAQGDAFKFSGRGWGHGVGLCQWGARGMAREGRGWQEILMHYYPGAEIAEPQPQ